MLSFPAAAARGRGADAARARAGACARWSASRRRPAKREPVKRPRAKSAALPSAPAALKRAEAQLIEHLATRVRLSEQAGVGTITITYHGAEDLQRLLDMLLRGQARYSVALRHNVYILKRHQPACYEFQLPT